jgi:hypothetical protein
VLEVRVRATRSSDGTFELPANQPTQPREVHYIRIWVGHAIDIIAARALHDVRIAYAFIKMHLWLWVSLILYFAAYVPYSMQSKRISDHVTTVQILPLTSLGGLSVTLLEFAVLGFIVSRRDKMSSLSRALAFWRQLTFNAAAIITGVACAIISMMTTASYMLHGAALVTMGLLLRGGMLSLAPINDRIQRRHISRQTWVGFSLALAAIMCGIASAGAIPPIGIAIFIAYLCAYALNLNFYGKNQGKFRFLCSAQLVACTTMLLISAIQCIAMLSHDGIRMAIVHAKSHGSGLLSISVSDALHAISIGAMAQLTGIFGPMILMSPTEQTYSVPINRSGSVIATVAAQHLLGNTLSVAQMLGVAFFVIAIVVLALRPQVQCALSRDKMVSNDEVRNTVTALRAQAASC